MKRRKTGEQVKTLGLATPSAASSDSENADLGLSPDTFLSDTDAGDSKLDADGPTDLESVLPYLDQGESDIVDYEDMQLFEGDLNKPRDLEDNISPNKLPSGRRSIYVDAFNLALETVLNEESHLFDEKEGRVFDEWRGLSYEAQYLYEVSSRFLSLLILLIYISYVRLFLRKTSTWHRTSRLGYHSDISDIPAAIGSLQSFRPLPHASGTVPVTDAEITGLDSHFMGNSFAFADALAEETATLEEVSSLLSLVELKGIGKEAKIRGKNKTELLDALRRMSRSQSGLGSVGLRILKTKSDPEIISKHNISDIPHISAGGSHRVQPNENANYLNRHAKLLDQAFGDSNRDKHFILKILNSIGSCVRISSSTQKLFERVHMVYYRSTRWTGA